MSAIITVGLDLAKNVFKVHGADAYGRSVLRKKSRRAQVLESSDSCRPASWRCKPVAALTSGCVRSANWGTRCD
jgi:hypothetical protein